MPRIARNINNNQTETLDLKKGNYYIHLSATTFYQAGGSVLFSETV